MKTTGKVQTNKNNVNVLVEIDNSDNKHISQLDVEVEVEEVLTETQILQLWKERKRNQELKEARTWLMKQEIYAISNCRDESIDLEYNDIVKFTYKK